MPTKAQETILNNDDAMAIIIVEAAKAVAEKVGCTPAEVHDGLKFKDQNCMEMFNSFVATGVDECAKLVITND